MPKGPQISRFSLRAPRPWEYQHDARLSKTGYCDRKRARWADAKDCSESAAAWRVAVPPRMPTDADLALPCEPAHGKAGTPLDEHAARQGVGKLGCASPGRVPASRPGSGVPLCDSGDAHGVLNDATVGRLEKWIAGGCFERCSLGGGLVRASVVWRPSSTRLANRTARAIHG